MSIIGGVGGGLFQLLKGIRTDAANALQNAATASSAATAGSASQAIPGGHHGHGHHGGLFQQIASAVTNALQSAQGSTSSADPDTAIKNAIAKILTQVSSSSTTAGSATSVDPDGDGDTDAAGQADSDAGSAITSFLQSLQSAGVTPQQFRQDFLAAVQSLNGGQADPSSSSQLLPVGTLLNALA